MLLSLGQWCYVPVRRSDQLVHFNESIKTREGKKREEAICSGVFEQTFAYLNLVSVLPLAPMHARSSFNHLGS